MKPVRLQRSRQRKNESPNGLPNVYVGRGSSWGNPFRVVEYDGRFRVVGDGTLDVSQILLANTHFDYASKADAAKDAVKCYGLLFMPYSHNAGNLAQFLQSETFINDVKMHLKGKNLSCWCRPDEPCHADLLLEVANK